MKLGSLFSGIGGIELGLGAEVAWHCENDASASSILETHWPEVPNLGDITTIDWDSVPPVEILTGGFPCQDISNAGKGAGIVEGTRSGLWIEYARAIGVLRPRYVFIENVAALYVRGFDRVLADLASLGFDAEWTNIRASDIGAPHKRDRIFILASNPDNGPSFGEWSRSTVSEGSPVTNTSSQRRQQVAGRAPSDEGTDGRGTQSDHFSAGIGEGGVQATPIADATGIGERESTDETNAVPRSGDTRAVTSGRGLLTTSDTESFGRQRRGLSVESPREQGQSGNPDNSIDPESDSGRLQECEELNSETEQGATDWDSRWRHTDGLGVEAWGEYGPAIERWQRITRPAPPPVDERKRLNPAFVEWMMGFPEGWTAGVKRTAALKCLGNAVVPQCAALAWAILIDRLEGTPAP